MDLNFKPFILHRFFSDEYLSGPGFQIMYDAINCNSNILNACEEGIKTMLGAYIF